MNANGRISRMCLLASLALAGTFGSGLSVADPVMRREVEQNGPRLNGISLASPKGQAELSLLFASLKNPRRGDGSLVPGVTLEGTRIRRAGGPEDADLTGMMLEGEASNHAPLRLRIDRVTTAPDPNPSTSLNENVDIALYAVSYQWGTWTGSGPARSWQATSDFSPLCPAGELAIPLAGRWDYHRGMRGDSGRVNSERSIVTFACQGAAIAKCIEKMGYKPWLPPHKAADGGAAISMDALHQACVRAVRADYCGNGDSLTTEGQPVNFYDKAGILKDTENWDFEAAWTAAGALCVNHTRLQKTPEDAKKTVTGYIAERCLTAWSDRPCSEAGGAKAALLFTEQRPQPAPASK